MIIICNSVNQTRIFTKTETLEVQNVLFINLVRNLSNDNDVAEDNQPVCVKTGSVLFLFNKDYPYKG